MMMMMIMTLSHEHNHNINNINSNRNNNNNSTIIFAKITSIIVVKNNWYGNNRIYNNIDRSGLSFSMSLTPILSLSSIHFFLLQNSRPLFRRSAK